MKVTPEMCADAANAYRVEYECWTISGRAPIFRADDGKRDKLGDPHPRDALEIWTFSTETDAMNFVRMRCWKAALTAAMKFCAGPAAVGAG